MRRPGRVAARIGVAAGGGILLLAAAACGPKPIYRPESAAAAAGAPAAAPSRVAEVALSWLGTPYRYGGRDRRGIDCSGLAGRILADLGVRLPRTVRDQRMQGRGVARGEIAPGDLVFFRLGSRRVNHVGVVIERDRFIHSSSSRGVVIDRLSEGAFDRGFVEARRVLAAGGARTDRAAAARPGGSE